MVLVITSDRVAQLRETLSAAVSHLPVILNCGLDIFLLFYYCIIVCVCVCVCMCVSAECIAQSASGSIVEIGGRGSRSAPKQWAAGRSSKLGKAVVCCNWRPGAAAGGFS
jgi:hypothetical protein